MDIMTKVEEIKKTLTLPLWAAKFIQRIINLDKGRWSIILTVEAGKRDWTILNMGGVEKP